MLSKNNAPTLGDMRPKSREYMFMKPKKNLYSADRNLQGGHRHPKNHGANRETI